MEEKIKKELYEEILDGANTAFVNSNFQSNLAYRPQFLYNDDKNKKKVLSSLEAELRHCSEFIISVAFITEGGITPFLQIFKELEKKGVHGKILTTNYMYFNNPKALERLNKLSNIELRMFYVEPNDPGLHTKGYIFRQKEEIYKIIIGSSNLTLKALTLNKEWNTEITSTQHGEVAQEILSEFQRLWNDSQPLDEWIDTYTKIYEEQKRVVKHTKIPSIEQYKLKPNAMQVTFTERLHDFIIKGKKRALLISATGTGKTYASAFALRNESPERILFLVHRKQIAKQAKKSYQNVFGDKKSLGLLFGMNREINEDFLFSTVQTMSKKDVMEQFKPDEFTFIVIDEAHHSAANSYKRIMDYFKPKLWLGMTATPDRAYKEKNEASIYEIFDYNIAYEIRLQKAMEEDLLCPFHYFAITDIEIDGEMVTDDKNFRNFNLLTSDVRVDYILEQAEYYGYSGERVKGLIFCSRIKEAEELSLKFNKRGLRTLVLSGSDSDEAREEAIERLAGPEGPNCLDYILSVDIFSEGLDVPEANQIIMLRPTESPIVFVQQLGRGLRKSEGKEYAVILDFIGNYKNNFMIPIALSGDRTYNKDNMRKYLMEGSRLLPGSSSIHFDEISRKKIFESIDKVTTTKKMLVEKYQNLKEKLGKIPTVLDFYDYGEIDPLLILNYAGSYYHFLGMVEAEYVSKIEMSTGEVQALRFVSLLLANGKRPHELVILQKLLKYEKVNFESVKRQLFQDYNLLMNEDDYESAIRVLEGKFFCSQTDKKKYSKVAFFESIEPIEKRVLFNKRWIEKHDFCKQLNDLILLGLKRYQDLYINSEDGLTLYQKYSRKDICRLLNWKQDDSSTLYGYQIKYGTCPIFVTYNKKKDISEGIKYEDKFENPNIFSWMTRSVGAWRREAAEIMDYQNNCLKIYLFVKKSDDEGTDYYYMGKMKPILARETTNANGAPIMNIKMQLENAVREDIYEYIVE